MTVQCVTVQYVTVQCIIVTVQCVSVQCVTVTVRCVTVECVPVSDLYVCEDEDKLHCEEVAESKLCSRDDDYARHCPRSCGMCGRSCLSFTD